MCMFPLCGCKVSNVTPECEPLYFKTWENPFVHTSQIVRLVSGVPTTTFMHNVGKPLEQWTFDVVVVVASLRQAWEEHVHVYTLCGCKVSSMSHPSVGSSTSTRGETLISFTTAKSCDLRPNHRLHSQCWDPIGTIEF